MLINAGIEMIYYEEGYDDPLSDQMFSEAGLKVVRLNP
jgi:deoxycytidylate deaminase